MAQEAFDWLPSSCELEDLSDIGGRLLPQLILRISLRSIGGGMDVRTHASLVNLVRLRDKAAADWETARAAAARYVEEQLERTGPSGVTVSAWHALTDATNDIEDVIDATHRALKFAFDLKEWHEEPFPTLQWPSGKQAKRIARMRHEIQHRNGPIRRGTHPPGAPFTLLIEQHRAVVGDRSLAYSDLAGAIRRLTAVAVEFTKRV